MRDDLCCGTIRFNEPVTLEWLKERNQLFSTLCGDLLDQQLIELRRA